MDNSTKRPRPSSSSHPGASPRSGRPFVHGEAPRLREEIRRLSEQNARLVKQLCELGKHHQELQVLHVNVLRHGTNIENELFERMQEAKLESLMDPLTGIHNRLKIQETLDQELRRRRSGDTEELWAIMFDIDDFKAVNDNYGHHVGDSVLLGIISLVKGLVRRGDVFARWGGDEFIIVVNGSDERSTRQLAERIRATVAKHSFARVGCTTCSFGVAQYRENDSMESFLERVDDRLYRAKNRGRNCVVSADHVEPLGRGAERGSGSAQEPQA